MKLGFEAEYSDCLTMNTARGLYELWGRDFSTFQDRWGGYSKPKQNYEIWNCMSDGSLRNTDGSRCMWSYVDPVTGDLKGAKSGKTSEHRYFWKGIELQSRTFDSSEIESVVEELQSAGEVVEANGGVASRSLYNSMHVHVDLSELDWRVVASMVEAIYSVQEDVRKMGTEWPNLRLFREDEVDELREIREDPDSTPEDWYNQYRIVRMNNGKWRKSGSDADRVRRLIDVSPYFNKRKSYQTVEFRCFSSSFDPELQRKQIEFAESFVRDFLSGDFSEYKVIARVEEVLNVRDN